MLKKLSFQEQPYNERVDIFSFGITLCEIIGRCSSDPDIMPRGQDFGIDQQSFSSQFVEESCPRPFLHIAFKCASVIPEERPPFATVQRWLSDLLDSTDKDIAYETVSKELEAFMIRNEEELPISTSEPTLDSFTASQTLSSPGKRRRSTDMGYASGRSREESPRDGDGDGEMGGLK